MQRLLDCRLVLLQAWRAGEFNAKLWQDMVKFLPTSFEGNLTQPRDALVAHSGESPSSSVFQAFFKPELLPALTLLEAQSASILVRNMC